MNHCPESPAWLDEIEEQLEVRVLGWGVRRADGGVTASSEKWARDVHEMAGLPLVRFDGGTCQWVDVA